MSQTNFIPFKQCRDLVTMEPSEESREVVAESYEWVFEKTVKGIPFVMHLMGKLRRFYLVYIRKRYVQRQLALRKGECHQCGLCCSFLFVCPMLTQEQLCRIYKKCRSEICKVFPINQRDIAEVALCGGTCGYRFEVGFSEKTS
jgi:hypothetical protein